MSYPACPPMPAEHDIEVTPVISTCHITRADNNILERIEPSLSITGLVSRYEYGWEFSLSGLKGEECENTQVAMLQDGLSSDLVNALLFFARLGYHHVKFDRDGDVIEELTQFEW